MSVQKKSGDPLDEYWGALVADRPVDANELPSSGDDARFFELLDDLNDVRLLLRDDSTIKANLSDTNRIVPTDVSVDIGTEIDGYRLTRTLGRGGMGIVYAAEQLALGREVALKIIRTGPLATAEDLARFEAEANATAALNHPGIVSVFDSGQWQGHHYFSMQLVDGPTLREAFADGPIETRRAAAYVRHISDAIHHAHEHNVLHRDIKPSNVIIDLDTDQPCVTDFGLAKLFEPDSDTSTAYEWTKSGAMVGTPSYMSPEQALGQSKHVSPASDVYSIGAILYEALTGRAPFRAASPIETMRQVVDAEPAAPRMLNPDVSRDLETICLKCLAKKPEARYESASALRNELDRYLNGQPILARPLGNVAKAWRWCTKNRAMAASLALIATLVLGGGGLHQWRLAGEIANTRAAEREAKANLADAQKARELAERDYERADLAVDRMLYTLGAVNLESVPKGEELRLELLEEAAKLQRQFVEDHPGDADRVVKLIVAEQRLAEVTYGQGDIQGAEGLLNDALERIEHFEGERGFELNEAELVTQNKLSNWYVAQGMNDKAIEILKWLLARCKVLKEQDPANETTWNENYATNAVNLAILSTENESKQLFAQEAINAFQAQLDGDEPILSDHLGLCTSRMVLANILQNSDPTKSLELYELNLAHLTDEFSENPTHVLVRMRLGELHFNKANLLRDLKRVDDALESYRRSITIREAFSADFPNNVLCVAYLAGTYNAVGNTLFNSRKFDQALPEYDRALVILDRLFEQAPDNYSAKQFRFDALMQKGSALVRLDRPQEAPTCFEEAREVAAQLKESVANDMPQLDIIHGESLCGLGDVAEGLATMRAGLELATSQAAAPTDNEHIHVLQGYFLQVAVCLGRYDLGDQAKEFVDWILENDKLGTSANHTAASFCGAFCQFRFTEGKPEDEQLSRWFGERVVLLLQASEALGYDPPVPYAEDENLESFRSLEQFSEVANLMRRLGGEKPLVE
jgi:serine/threonine protein kinase